MNRSLRYCDPFDDDAQSYRSIRREYDSTLGHLGLDRARWGSEDWNPFSTFIAPKDKVLIKPNLVRHIHLKRGSLWSILVAPVVLRLTIDYAFRALGRGSSLIVGDAPLQSTDFDAIARAFDFPRFVEYYEAKGYQLEFKDFRRESSVKDFHESGNVVHSRKQNNPLECFERVNLGANSFLCPIQERHRRFRVTEYRASGMRHAHSKTDHRYLVHRDVLDATVIINLSKLKTHRKAGLTCAMKNLVGINGHKDYLPHHTLGAQQDGGDEYRVRNVARSLESIVLDWTNATTYLSLSSKNAARVNRVFAFVRRVLAGLSRRVGTRDKYKEGSWHGNDTLWRTLADLNRIAYYVDRNGELCDVPQRVVFNIVDGIVAGDREGPMEPRERPIGLLAAGFSTYLLDYVMCGVMGFDWRKIPALANTVQAESHSRCPSRITRSPEQAHISLNGDTITYADLIAKHTMGFEPTSGWKGHIEV